MPDERSYNLGGIITLCITMVILGFFFFLFKSEACKSSPDKPEICREEFYEIRNSQYSSDHKCQPGATIEIVNSPPAPKAGIFCRCLKNGVTGSPSVSSSTH
jgi:hypothetical protein